MSKRMAVAMLAGLVLAGCGGGGDEPAVNVREETTTTEGAEESPSSSESTTTEATTTTTEAESGADAAADYFRAFGTYNPAEMEAMVSLSAPGSPAFAYARYQITQTQANQAAGSPTSPSEPNIQGDTIEFCDEFSASGCTVFADFVVSGDQLTTFSVDGVPIDGQVVADTGVTANVGGSTATILAGRVGPGEVGTALSVVLSISAPPGGGEVGVYSATYIDPSGGQFQASQTVGPTSLAPGGTATYIVNFSGPALGGEVIIPVFSPDFATLGDLRMRVG